MKWPWQGGPSAPAAVRIPRPARRPQIGDPAFVDGEFGVIDRWKMSADEARQKVAALVPLDQVDALVERMLELYGLCLEVGPQVPVMKKTPTGGLEPTGEVAHRFTHIVNIHDLRWSEELGAWYMWGRCLSDAQEQQVIRWRDQGLLPARKTRQRASAPAGGEELNLFLALFRDPKRALEDRIDEYKARFSRRLTDGFADPDANDSSEED